MIEYFIRKKKLTLFIFILSILFGFLQYTQLSKQEMPNIIQKTAMITTMYPGADPEKVERDISIPLEQKLREVENIKELESVSQYGISTINIETEGNADAKAVWDVVRQKIDDMEALLPEGAAKPAFVENLNKTFIHSYVITANSSEQLLSLNETVTSWKNRLSSIEGVSQILVQGLPDQEVKVQVDAHKLQQFQITWEQVMQAIKNENERSPLGTFDHKEMTYLLHVDRSRDATELERVMIRKTASGTPVYLKDVGKVSLSHRQADYMAYHNGKPAIVLTIMGNTGADVDKVYTKVSKEVTALQAALPPDCELHTLLSQTDRVADIFHHLSIEMMIAIGSVILICTLGLNLITSLAVALAIPISIAMGFIVLPMFGVTLNQVTVIGLIIVMGILVDDAVVVNDNIERRIMTLGETPEEAALNGTKEVKISILTATLATVASFAPLIFLTGDAGSFVKPLPYTVIFTLLASMVMSLTVIPIFREWYGNRRKGGNKQENLKPPGFLGKQIDDLREVYAGKLVPKLIKRPVLYASGGLLMSTLLYGLLVVIPIDLFPKTDDPHLSINVRMPAGTSIEETRRLAADIASWVQEQPHVQTVTYAAGGQAPMLFQDMTASASSGPTIGQIAVKGEEKYFQPDAVAGEWAELLETRYPGHEISLKIPKLGIPLGKPVSIRISGDDLEPLHHLAKSVKHIVMSTEGTLNVQDNTEHENYVLNFIIDKQAMDHYQVSYSNITNTLLLAGKGLNFSEFDIGGDLARMSLSLDNSDQDPEQLLGRLNVTNAAGIQIPLSQLARIEPAISTPKLVHYQLKPTVTVEADINGSSATRVVNDIVRELNQLTFPPGYHWEIGGEISGTYELLEELGVLYIVVLVLIFFLIFLQFYSFSAPAIILTTVYMAIAGGVLGLFLMNMPVSFMGVLGLMALAGIVVRNGIVLLEFIEEERREGVPLEEAVVGATRSRFRPIILTSVTAIVGMIPISTIGEILFKPLGFTIIFGLMYSTLLTLFVVPSLYLIVAKFKLKRQNIRTARHRSGQDLSL